ncbi:helix-turn-helix domain-containing protein [Clostridium merdae]|uniref:helix-turn-helix domain-containing protein n=1 Tax=Clostridium merdae TaxID=1958780 RepID=UPI000A2692BD|nr:helix-turn-helix transcriptional regulator [Clostridium merdae]
MYQNIRGLREDKDLNQKQMAQILNIAQTTYSDYELGKINIPIEILKKLSLYFNTSIDYLLDMTDVKESYQRKNRES